MSHPAPSHKEIAPPPGPSLCGDSKDSERRARHLRTGIVLGLLGFCLVTQLSFLYIASSDPSSVAEPDYYAKAIAWEDRQRQEARNRELGWVADAQLSELRNGARVLQIGLRDAKGAPLADCRQVRVKVFHKARAGRAFSATLRSSATPGKYEATLPLRRAGVWEVRLEAWHSGSQFTLRRDVIAP